MTERQAAGALAEGRSAAKTFDNTSIVRQTAGLRKPDRRELFGRFLTFCTAVSAAVGNDAAIDAFLRLKDAHNRRRR